ncbi:ATP-binding protein [Patescibacteria group bacterium]|nr:ATP-binding protein [Patescibacteria group bacterium]MBU4511841.1 ATP-binding protein [Patescibacteria group bacterium]MCG2692923.1 ATP-binding protein [Candidatus Parcubacteria bacterium]
MIIQRDIYIKIKPYLSSPEAIVITGMRRTGKTTLLKFIYDKISSDNKLYIDLENPINQKYFEEEDYEKIKFNFEVKGLNFNRQAYLFLDEIQFVKNLPQIVKYFFDHYKIKFFLTGSSSFYIKNLFSESLAGRKYIFELFPLNFKEFLLLKEEKLIIPKIGQKISKTIFNTFNRFYEEYLKFGGFPGVVAKKDFQEKKMALDDIFSSYFQLEIVQLGDYKKTNVIRDLILLLMQRVGSKLDVQKIAQELAVSRPTIYDYLAFLEGTYFIKLIKLYSKSKDVEIRGANKIYLCDSGLVNNSIQVSEGALFENSIFQLLRPQGEINYYQKKGGVEIDFIFNKNKAYEVKLKPSQQDLNKLDRISKELKIKDFKLISKSYSNIENVIYGFNI